MKIPNLLLASIMLLLFSGCAAPPPVELRILHAGSLIVPFKDIEVAFEAAYPHVDVLLEAHGSIQCARHVSELHELADIVAVADYTLIPLLMYHTVDETSGRPHAEWTLEWATNRLMLAYTSQSRYADEITADNWYSIINRPGVRLGLPDPRFDAAGYRGLMALQLTEHYYHHPLIFENAFLGKLRYPITVIEEGGQQIIHVPEIIEPRPDRGLVVRGSSIHLIALLESGDLDYAFEYESVSRQHGYEFIYLPDAINLGNAQLADEYKQVEVRLDFRRFATVEPHFFGTPISYGLTIPTNAPHPEIAADFVAFLLGSQGQAILAQHEHPLHHPPRADYPERLPRSVQQAISAQP